ncbi:hypothetical protein BV394_05910 [Brevirhabdus pacifica]|uniref:Fatty acid desaturase domain-containing protein n=2 Tax=Brevirhabdus pacifica TaxID=1267768 RepID=A0A1U7DHD0_9RHOB|nr:alkane 1-monooxygenase [Brevirhabdus pacifica]APX89309.1 hypothetical protein BV394_05910 [Brevirhabdus pacifica]OWU76659.1 hypothetical protein ATO5_10375 [Loktanella sp. 22II-4b]PJJ86072.1 alkane 1-monooxygenase [Brevirhabdus pacifica]
MQRTIANFAIATLAPGFLLALAALWGGAWPWLALFSVTLMGLTLDAFARVDDPVQTPSPKAAATLPVVLALAHFVLLFLTVAALSDVVPPAKEFGTGANVALFLAAGIYMGQVSNANAHELIHRPGFLSRKLGTLLYISLLFGHHASAHPAVHHRHVATRRDPNTSRLNESFYRFLPRAWIGSFRAGLAVEKKRLLRRQRRAWSAANPYWSYSLGALAFTLLFAGIGGWRGALIYVGLAAYATTQLLLSDYVQHYGLRRRRMANGRWEPVGPQHSWNAPHWFSSMMMMNAPRHSDHHAHPGKAFQHLSMPDEGEAPQLPFSLPVMGALALLPRKWRQVMNPRVKVWHDRAQLQRA